MIGAMLALAGIFLWTQSTARMEPASYNSGTNLLVSLVMVGAIFVLTSFTTLTTIVDAHHLRIAFGFGIFRKKFLLTDIASVACVKNRWYYGWGIRFCFSPRMWLYTVSGFDAVELVMKNGKRYRIGTDAPHELEAAIKRACASV
jgi:hypothetical protein